MQLKSIKDNFEGPSWSNRIFFYFCLFSFILIILMLILCFFGVLNIDLTPFDTSQYAAKELQDIGFYDNERYLLSALVQSLAATIALVITLSLVAVQLAAQSYSARVIDVYKRNPDMWILLFIYIITIFYGLGLTKIVGLGILGNYMEGAIFIAYFMGFFAFVCLVPYVWNILKLVDPSNLINLLAVGITKETILEAMNNKGKRSPEEPIIDIMNIALERNDSFTVRDGLESITNSVVFIFKDTQFKEEDKLLNHIIRHIGTIGIQALNRQNGDSTLSTITNLEIIGISAAENNYPETVLETIEALENIGFKVAETYYQSILQENIKALGSIGSRAIDENMGKCTETALTALMNIGPIAANKMYDGSAIEASEAIGIIGNKVADKKDGITAQVAVEALLRVGRKSAEKNLDISAMVAARELGSMGIKTAENKLDTATAVAINALGDIAINAAHHIKFGTSSQTATMKLGEVGAKAAEQELGSATTAENILTSLLETAKENKWEFIVKECEKGLENIEQKRNEEH
nr:DUF2254 family protein [uncultured Methanolobus sp.]